MLHRSLFYFVVLGVSFGCGGSTSTPRPSEIFPTAVGSTWSFSWHDLATGKTDTVAVRLTEEKNVVPWGVVQVLVVEHASWTDTVLMVAQGDTVTFLPGSKSKAGGVQFVLPLEVGARWGSAYDSSYVGEAGKIAVPAGTFADGVHVTWDFPYVHNTMGRASTWVVPGVGIVSETRMEYSLVPRVNYHRELIDYHVPGGPR